MGVRALGKDLCGAMGICRSVVSANCLQDPSDMRRIIHAFFTQAFASAILGSY